MNTDEQARCAFTARDHVEFQASGIDSEREFLQVKYDVEPADFDSVGEFLTATAGDATVEFASGSGDGDDSDSVAERAMTVDEKLEFEQSTYTNPADFLADRHGLEPEAFASAGAYSKAVAERGEQ